LAIKWNIDLVREFVEDKGCKLLSTEYVNCKSYIRILGACGHEFDTVLSRFLHKTDPICGDCAHQKAASYKKITKLQRDEYMTNFGDGDILIDSEYKNTIKKLDFICHKCNKPFKMSWAKYSSGQRHEPCSNKIAGEKLKHSYEYVKKCIEEKGCELISDAYERIGDKLDVKLSCGHIEKRSLYSIQHFEPICKKCSGLAKLTFDEVKSNFLELGFFVGDNQEYKNVKTKLSFYDKHGYKYFYSFSVIQNAKTKGRNNINPFKNSNIYALENISLWIKNNRPDWIFNCDKYIKSTHNNLFFKCKICEKTWYSCWNNIYNLLTGCPHCLESKGEIVISKYLNKNKIYYDPQYKFEDCRYINLLRFDFAIFSDYEKQNLIKIIEYDGELHFKPQHSILGRYKKLMDIRRNDKIKTKYCLANNIDLLRIPYWDFKNIEQILTKELNLEEGR